MTVVSRAKKHGSKMTTRDVEQFNFCGFGYEQNGVAPAPASAHPKRFTRELRMDAATDDTCMQNICQSLWNAGI